MIFEHVPGLTLVGGNQAGRFLIVDGQARSLQRGFDIMKDLDYGDACARVVSPMVIFALKRLVNELAVRGMTRGHLRLVELFVVTTVDRAPGHPRNQRRVLATLGIGLLRERRRGEGQQHQEKN